MDEAAPEEVLLDGNAEARAYDFYMPSGVEVCGPPVPRARTRLPIQLTLCCLGARGIILLLHCVLSSLRIHARPSLPRRCCCVGRASCASCARQSLYPTHTLLKKQVLPAEACTHVHQKHPLQLP